MIIPQDEKKEPLVRLQEKAPDGWERQVIRVNVLDEDIKEARRLATVRNDRKQALGIKSKRYDKGRTDWQSHFFGLRGEIAAAKFLGLEVDTTEHLSGDHGIDLVTSQGFKIQVKTRKSRTYDYSLNTTEIADFVADVGFQVVAAKDLYDVELIGWISKLRFWTLCEKANYMRGWRLAVSPWRLTAPGCLLPLINRPYPQHELEKE